MSSRKLLPGAARHGPPASFSSSSRLRRAGSRVFRTRRARSAIVVTQIADETSEGAKLRRDPRHDYPLNPAILASTPACTGPGSSADDQDVVTRIAPDAEGHGAQRIRHVPVDHLEYAEGRPFDAEPEWVGHMPADGLGRAFRTQGKRASEEGLGVDVSENEVRVGHRRPGAARS